MNIISVQNNASSNKTTTIKVSNATKQRLNNLNLYPRETYEEILIRILDILNTVKQNPEQARAKLFMLDKQKQNNLNLLAKNINKFKDIKKK
jgi:hypothetical protein